jgi:hypothetical protein
MSLAIRSTIVYFLLIFIYKLLGDTSNNYWVNSYWIVSSIYFMVVFIDIKSQCIQKIYKKISLVVIYYWGVMALLRIYIMFNIHLHYALIKSTSKITVGAVAIILILIYLTSQTWHQK